MASMTLSSTRLSRRERRLGRQEMPRWDAQSRAQARQARQARQQLTMGNTIQTSIHLMAKLVFITVISVLFLYCASTILSTSAGLPIKAMALGAWACGFVPVSYYLWNS